MRPSSEHDVDVGDARPHAGRGRPPRQTVRYRVRYREGTMSVLDGILAGVREDLEERKRVTPLAELRSRVADAAPALDPLPAFRAPGVSIIAEVKRKSP